MSKDAKLLGWILTDGEMVWCGNKGGQWQELGNKPFKTYATEALAKIAIAKLKAKKWDMNGVTAQPIRSP